MRGHSFISLNIKYNLYIKTLFFCLGNETRNSYDRWVELTTAAAADIDNLPYLSQENLASLPKKQKKEVVCITSVGSLSWISV